MLRLTKSWCGVLLLTALLVGGCKKKYVPATDGGLDGGGPENTAALCSDGIDNDGDGDTDCADSECQGLAVCIESNCTNGIDDDGDGYTDCADSDCQGTFECRENTANACRDGIDNDGDGHIDCADDECWDFSFCEPVEVDCEDGLDNDEDGLTDCEDSDCLALPVCGGFCYPVDFQAPGVWGMAITEANDDLDPATGCVQYDVVIQVASPEPNTQVCLYIDDLNGTAVECRDPSAENPMTIRVTLCAGEHTLYARVEQGVEVCAGPTGLDQVMVQVYENPSCVITQPSPLSTDPGNPTCWNQADVAAEGDIDVMVNTSGADAQLWVAGALAGTNPVGGGGNVDFSDTSLGADGDITINALCDNAGNGNGSTWSPDYYITLDTVGPNVQILSPTSGTEYSAADCTNGFPVVVTGVEAGQQVCAHYTGQTPPPAACSSASTGVGDQLSLTVACIEGANLTVEANTTDACGNPGQATILVTADTGYPVALIESPANGQIYNKATDTINPGTNALEMNIVACTDQPYDPANITLTIDGLLRPMVATVQAVACLGQSHRITWSAPFAFSQSASGLQTPHTVVVSVSDGVNTTVVTSDFHNDTLAPVLELGCAGCQPAQAFYTPSQDNCSATPEFDVRARMRVFGLEIGEPVNLAVTSSGVPVGPPYQMPSAATFIHFVDFNLPCGVELQIGQNLLTATATDQAGNPAIPATRAVAYGSGSIQSPSSGAVLSVGNNCSGGANYGIQVVVEVDSAQPDGTPVEVFASSSAGAWSYPPPGTDVWLTDCSSQGSPCQHTFCVNVPVGVVEQSDIAIELNMNSFPVSGGPTGITVDISDPPGPTNVGRSVVSRRAAQIQLSWDASEDPQVGVLSSWDVRCTVDTPLTGSNWASARQFAGEPAPAAGGTGQTMLIAEDVNGNKIRAGHEFYCGIVGTSTSGLSSALVTFPAITDTEIGLLEYASTVDGYTQYDFDWWYWPSISAAGDVNGDGKDDLLVGYGGSTIGGHAAALVLGSASGPTAPVAITCANASFGSAMAGIGDFDNDGYPDIAVGAVDQDRVYIFRGGANRGSASFDCSSADVTIVGISGSWLGSVVVPAGDFDGDGFADLAVGAVSDNGGDGAAYVIFGRDEGTWPVTINLSSGANADGALHINGAVGATDYLGDSIAAWDFNKDGATDVVFGIPFGGASGQVAILAGNPAALKTPNTVIEVAFTSLQTINFPSATTAEAGLGMGITPIDIDGDTWTDLAVGGRFSEIGSSANSGNVVVFRNNGSGTITSTIAVELHGNANDMLGVPVGGVYNLTLPTPVPWKLNGLLSSPSDLAVFAGAKQYNWGTSSSTGPGYAALWYAGINGSVGVGSADLLFAAPAGSVSYQWAAYVGDLNGDGYVDLAVGDPDYGAGGRVVLFY